MIENDPATTETAENGRVQGRRSPRWAFNTKMKIPCLDGELYLFRRRLFQTPWFGAYIHDIYKPDLDADPHDHPWSFISIVLQGGYTEELHPIPNVLRDEKRRQTWRRFSIHRMNTYTAHRIIDLKGGHTKTLILVGPRRSNWGFFTPLGWMPWNEYENAKRPPATGTGSSTGGSA